MKLDRCDCWSVPVRRFRKTMMEGEEEKSN